MRVNLNPPRPTSHKGYVPDQSTMTEVERFRIYQKTYMELIKSGFSDEESEWAAERRFNLHEPIMMRAMALRAKQVHAYMKLFHLTREVAIEKLSHQLRMANELRGESTDNLFQLIRIVSPGMEALK